ncbi:RNA polymerase sigma-70 factor (ECF subfamily) [Elusimicrobium posterum]|uniref:RNA polymerase sigma factor n=1 Tax=Elusimicrobium posterum TaxID=3116653 RepID=UPI003C74EA7B
MQDFDKIYNEYFGIIYSYIISRVQNESTAQDLAAALWQKVIEKAHTFDKERGNISQWLFGIARNEINMYRRLYYVKKFLSLTDFEESVNAREKSAQQQMEENELNKRLLEAMARLKEKERDLIALKFYSGLNNRQIAEVANISESNAGTIINRAINKLRILLEDL